MELIFNLSNWFLNDMQELANVEPKVLERNGLTA